MRLLLVHNFYGSAAPSGENAAYLAERELLSSAGYDVKEFTRSSDEIRGKGLRGLLRGGLSYIWSFESARALRMRVQTEDPDIVHIHNIFPLVSPSILWALRDVRAATVLTLHNFRLVCASAMLSQDGVPCTRCLDDGSVIPSLFFGCYRGSRVATIPLTTSIALHRSIQTWTRHVDAFIALTKFQRQMFIRAGLPADRIHLKPHFYDAAPTPVPWSSRANRVAFVGRISPEKGLDTLLHAWSRWGAEAPELVVAGDGPQGPSLARWLEENGPIERVKMLGALSFEDAQKLIATCKLLVVPSRVFEGFPMVIREAFALGVPVCASEIGSLRDLIRPGYNGVLFPPGDPEALLNTIRRVWADQEGLERLSHGARMSYEQSMTRESNLAQLARIYAEAMRVRAKRTHRVQ